jgi:hypothetical protein
MHQLVCVGKEAPAPCTPIHHRVHPPHTCGILHHHGLTGGQIGGMVAGSVAIVSLVVGFDVLLVLSPLMA